MRCINENRDCALPASANVEHLPSMPPMRITSKTTRRETKRCIMLIFLLFLLVASSLLHYRQACSILPSVFHHTIDTESWKILLLSRRCHRHGLLHTPYSTYVLSKSIDRVSPTIFIGRMLPRLHRQSTGQFRVGTSTRYPAGQQKAQV